MLCTYNRPFLKDFRVSFLHLQVEAQELAHQHASVSILYLVHVLG